MRKFSLLHMVLGFIGLGLIIYGYYASTILFDGPGAGLVNRMLTVLATTILGTFLIFRYSVALIINVWRRTRKGYLSSTDVVALSPIMHRMKSSASSLTLIAVLTAVSLGINTLISYYTIDKTTVNTIPAHFVIKNEMLDQEVSAEQKLEAFEQALKEHDIEYDLKVYHYERVTTTFMDLLVNPDGVNHVAFDVNQNQRILPASEIGKKLKRNEMIVANFNAYSTNLLDYGINQSLTLPDFGETLTVVAYDDSSILTGRMQLSLQPVLLVSDEVYKKIVKEYREYSDLPVEDEEDLKGKFVEYQINIEDKRSLELAEKLYVETGANIEAEGKDYILYQDSQYGLKKSQLESLGLAIFVTAFLGLAFLFASGSVLYFKQMTEADAESSSYTVLRKIGYSEQDLMHGIYRKQLFNFRVPIIIGLFHSYFAVKSGWWFFGTEYGTPLVIMMVIYMLLYLVFAVMTVSYYRMVVKKAL